jgi:hypothetical protein
MRRILVETARRKSRLKYGANRGSESDGLEIMAPERPERLLALDETLERLAAANPQASELVKLTARKTERPGRGAS